MRNSFPLAGDGDSIANNPNEEEQVAQGAPAREEALGFVADATALQLHSALTTADVADPEWKIAILKRSGFHLLAAETLHKKRLTPAAADKYLARAKAALRAGELDCETIKMGILVFDEMMQRLGLAAGQNEFVYSTRQANPARELLIGFAHSLHP